MAARLGQEETDIRLVEMRFHLARTGGNESPGVILVHGRDVAHVGAEQLDEVIHILAHPQVDEPSVGGGDIAQALAVAVLQRPQIEKNPAIQRPKGGVELVEDEHRLRKAAFHQGGDGLVEAQRDVQFAGRRDELLISPGQRLVQTRLIRVQMLHQHPQDQLVKRLLAHLEHAVAVDVEDVNVRIAFGVDAFPHLGLSKMPQQMRFPHVVHTHQADAPGSGCVFKEKAEEFIPRGARGMQQGGHDFFQRNSGGARWGRLGYL